MGKKGGVYTHSGISPIDKNEDKPFTRKIEAARENRTELMTPMSGKYCTPSHLWALGLI